MLFTYEPNSDSPEDGFIIYDPGYDEIMITLPGVSEEAVKQYVEALNKDADLLASYQG